MVFASFQASGNYLVVREKLKRSQRGADKGLESSLRILLLIVSGPAVLPIFSDLRQVSTSEGDKFMLSIVSFDYFRSYLLESMHLFHQWYFERKQNVVKDFCFVFIFRKDFALID